jgi:hypothetical protein
LPLRGKLSLEKLRVFTDDENVKKSLTNPIFEIVESIDSADVFWGLGLERKASL